MARKKREIAAPAPPIAPAVVAEERTPEQLEDDLHMGLVVNLLARGYGFRTIADACRATYGFGQTRVRNLLLRAREALRSEVEERRPYAKAEQVARVRARIADLSAPRYGKQLKGKDGELLWDERGGPVREVLPVNGAQIARFEELLADLEGNREPVRVNVAVAMTVAMQAVFGTMSEERISQLADRARERKRLALVASNGKAVTHG